MPKNTRANCWGVFTRFRQRPHCAFRAPNIPEKSIRLWPGCVGACARFRQRPHRTVTVKAPNVTKNGTGHWLFVCWVFVRFRQRPHCACTVKRGFREPLRRARVEAGPPGGVKDTTQATPKRLPAGGTQVLKTTHKTYDR